MVQPVNYYCKFLICSLNTSIWVMRDKLVVYHPDILEYTDPGRDLFNLFFNDILSLTIRLQFHEIRK